MSLMSDYFSEILNNFREDYLSLRSSILNANDWEVTSIETQAINASSSVLTGIKLSNSAGDEIRLWGTLTSTITQPSANNYRGFVTYNLSATTVDYDLVNGSAGSLQFLSATSVALIQGDYRKLSYTDNKIDGSLIVGANLNPVTTMPSGFTKFSVVDSNSNEDGGSQNVFSGTFNFDSNQNLSGSLTSVQAVEYFKNGGQASTLENFLTTNVSFATQSSNVVVNKVRDWSAGLPVQVGDWISANNRFYQVTALSSGVSQTGPQEPVHTGGSSIVNGLTLLVGTPPGTITLDSKQSTTGPVFFNHANLGFSTDSSASVINMPLGKGLLNIFTSSAESGEADFNFGNNTLTISSSFGGELNAGAGNDTVNGGVGDDLIDGGQGNDTLNGGAGNDTFDVNTTISSNTITIKTNQTLPWGEFVSTLYEIGNDTIDGGVGLDTIYFANNLPSAVNIHIPYSTSTNSIEWVNGNYVSFKNPVAGEIGFSFFNGTYSQTDLGNYSGPNEYILAKNVEFLDFRLIEEEVATEYTIDLRPLYQGSANADTLYAMNADALSYLDKFVGSGYGFEFYEYNFINIPEFGADPTEKNAYVLSGYAGADILYGTDYKNNNQITINGNKYFNLGNDILDGGAGADTMIGGSGFDIYYVDNASDRVVESSTINDFDIVVTNTSYTLQADSGIERLVVYSPIERPNNIPLPSQDSLLQFSNPIFASVSSSTTVNITGSNYTHDLLGHDGANTITAGQLAGTIGALNVGVDGALLIGLGGADKLVGGEGNDLFFGGFGNDALEGGIGDDRFYMGFDFAKGSIFTDPFTQYNFLKDLGFVDNTNRLTDISNQLTGGHDTATGGIGFDTVVVGVPDSANIDPIDGDGSSPYLITTFKRTGNNNIRIETPYDSITVDSSVEFVEFLGLNNKFILPFLPVGDERSIDLYFQSIENQYLGDIAYVPASSFNDLVILDSITNLEDTDHFDGLAGNDFIKGTYLYRKVSGGAGDDSIYGEGFDTYYINNESNPIANRQELYGNDGNDTLSVWLGGIDYGQGYYGKTVLLDGGTGNDLYRISLSIDSENPELPKFEIADSSGTDTLAIAFDLDSDAGPYVYWADGFLNVLTVDNQLLGNIAAGVIERIRFSFEDDYFTSPIKDLVLINPVSSTYTGTTVGRLSGAATDDALIAIAGLRLNYDGGAGDDLIELNGISGGIAMGGAGKNIISVRNDQDTPDINISHTLSSTWTSGGMFSEIDLNFGFSYVVNSSGVFQGSDGFADSKEFFVNVIAGGANDVIRGNDRANLLDGGAGDDLIYSGQTYEMGLARDQLIGGAGNDTLIDENTGSIKAVLDGGAGNDTYIVSSSDPGINISPTRIIERTLTGTDTGGVDTVKFLRDSGILTPGTYSQVASTITVNGKNNYRVGDQVLLDFTSGAALDNNYTVTSSTGNSFTVTSSAAATNSGTVVYRDAVVTDAIYSWHDSNNLMLMGISEEALYYGLGEATYQGPYQVNSNGTFNSQLEMTALIDRNALDFIEIGSHSEFTTGARLKVSFDNGTINTAEIILSSSNGPSVLNGGDGTDYIIDTLYDDILIGGNGNDSIFSLNGRDFILGGNGDDVLLIKSSGQVLSGGSGSDQFIISGSLTDDFQPTIITDFRYWEGDQFRFNSEWLNNLDNYSFPPNFYDGTVSIDIQFNGLSTDFYLNFNNNSDTDDHYLFTITHRNSLDSYDFWRMENPYWRMSDLNITEGGDLSFKLDDKLVSIENAPEQTILSIYEMFGESTTTSADMSHLNNFLFYGYISPEDCGDLMTNAIDDFLDGKTNNDIINVASIYQDLNQSWFNWLQTYDYE